MRALRYERWGDPLECLELVDLPDPEPPGHLEVVVRLTHRPINPSDLTAVRGRYGVRPALPAIAGFEGAGVVEAVGSGVVGLAVGDRVIPWEITGSWRERATFMVGDLLPVPAGVSDEQAAQLRINPYTAWLMLTDELGLDRPGETRWLLQSAAGSALGRIIVELGPVFGYRTINIVRRAEQADELRRRGADEVIVAGAESIKDRVAAITGGEGAWAAIDAVGGPVGSEVIRSVRVGGTTLIIAALSGQPHTIGAGPMIFKRHTVKGFWLASWEAEVNRVVDILVRLGDLVAAGRLTLPVAASYDLADWRQAIEHAQRPGRVGKVILTG